MSKCKRRLNAINWSGVAGRVGRTFHLSFLGRFPPGINIEHLILSNKRGELPWTELMTWVHKLIFRRRSETDSELFNYDGEARTQEGAPPPPESFGP